jgi:exonuclease SbcC
MLLEQLNAYEAQFLTKTSSFKDSQFSLLAKIKEKLCKISKIDDINMSLLEESHTIISEQKQSISEIYIEHKEEKSKLQLLLEQALKNERLVSESLKEIKLLQKEEAIAQQLYSILGKDEFRNHVLSLVEKNLIQSTNHQLNQLCQGRYILKQQINKSTASSDYYIIDKLNFSMLRKVSTLSGGETFMVSLAMALALSELTRGENIIDNFFIDEGFGTLDEDSIEEVLEMLNSIKSQGKTITLISHIKSLTSRIPVNINVQKAESGSSKISTLYQ